jgi:hypothetical protein
VTSSQSSSDANLTQQASAASDVDLDRIPGQFLTPPSPTILFGLSTEQRKVILGDYIYPRVAV